MRFPFIVAWVVFLYSGFFLEAETVPVGTPATIQIRGVILPPSGNATDRRKKSDPNPSSERRADENAGEHSQSESKKDKIHFVQD